MSGFEKRFGALLDGMACGALYAAVVALVTFATGWAIRHIDNFGWIALCVFLALVTALTVWRGVLWIARKRSA